MHSRCFYIDIGCYNTFYFTGMPTSCILYHQWEIFEPRIPQKYYGRWNPAWNGTKPKDVGSVDNKETSGNGWKMSGKFISQYWTLLGILNYIFEMNAMEARMIIK